MKKNKAMRGIVVLASVLLMMTMLPIMAFANEGTKTVSDCTKDTENYLVGLTQQNDAVVGSTGGEWWVLPMVRADLSPKAGFYCRYLQTVKTYIADHINENEQLHKSKSTDNSRVIVALVSLGLDPADIDNHNLLQGLTSMKYVKKQGINGPIWALIALDSHNFEIPTAADPTDQVTRASLIEYILSKQLANGGWALSGTNADPDMTAMAMQSLAPYYTTDSAVKEALDKALACVSSMQKDNGGFASWGTVNSESCAQVLVALTAMGINPVSDSRFIKNGYSVVDALCEFAVDGGGFRHTMTGTLNGMATEQAAYALVAYQRFVDGKTSLYNMSDVSNLKTDVHIWDAGVVTKEATTTEEGGKTYTCIGCGETKEESIPVITLPVTETKPNTQLPVKDETMKEDSTDKKPVVNAAVSENHTDLEETVKTETPNASVADKAMENTEQLPKTGENPHGVEAMVLFVCSGAVLFYLQNKKKKENALL